MWLSLPNILKKSTADQRSRVVFRNTVASGIIKSCSLLCSFIIVPLTIEYLNPENYGIWMAMTSILYWFVFMDVGLGNGMRNYLSIYFSENDYDNARRCFSTTMLMITGIAFLIGLVAVPAIYLSDLNYIFNVHSISDASLSKVLVLAVGLSLMQFVVKNIGLVYIAMQKYAINDLIVFLGNLLAVIIIYILTKTTTGNLSYVVATFTGIPVLVFFLSAFFLFRSHPQLVPTRSSMDLKIGYEIVTKGLGFFVIQITSCLVIFASANILISHYCGPEQVAVYNVSFKIFNILIIGYTMLISPLWNAYTDAAVKGDFEWIRKKFKNSLTLWGLSVIAGLILLAVSSWVFKLWIGDSIVVPFEVSASILAYVCAFNLNNCVTFLINGLNKLRVQILTSLVATVLYLIAVYAIKGSFGIVGITLSMSVAYLFMAAIHLYQSKLLINRKAEGIWSR